jgi:hypothetical protein
MSMSAPMEPNIASSGGGGIPAADPGAGAPPPAEGFGIGGEEPDRPEETGEDAAVPPSDTPFRTPYPAEVGPEQPGRGDR